MQEYLAAGADAVMSKDEQRDALLNCLATRGNSSSHKGADDDDSDSFKEKPILDTTDFVWAEMQPQARDEIVDEFKEGAARTVADIKKLLETKAMHALPGELHALLGQCRAVGALQLQAQ
eukprot:2092880-Prymnesium_polylepis.1